MFLLEEYPCGASVASVFAEGAQSVRVQKNSREARKLCRVIQ